MTNLTYQEEYLGILLASGVLRFGEFKTKSGRSSPYFFNMGNIDSGERLGTVAGLYAALIAERFGAGVANLFGPAYKGIPLAVMTSFQLAKRLGHDVSFTFNRKEAKDHGEGGVLVGHTYKGGEKVVVIEDVITGGTSFSETLPLLAQHGVEVVGVVVGVDRQERGTGAKAALAEVAERYQVRTAALLSLDWIVARLHGQAMHGKVWIDDAMKARIDAYRRAYGATAAG